MELFFTGLASVYEPEHVARIFFPQARQVKARPPRRTDCILLRGGKRAVLVAVRWNERCAWRKVLLNEDGAEDAEYNVCAALFSLLRGLTGKEPPWGMLTGVRPVHLARMLEGQGMQKAQRTDYFLNRYFVHPDKYALVEEIAERQQPVLKLNTPRSCSLYISIPFCPTRCSYCSFVSRTVGQSADLIAPYVEALRREVAAIAALVRKLSLRMETVYIGGGTPTALPAALLEALMRTVAQEFDVPALREYTVEAGRPDCTDAEKLDVIRRMGATRISINPQTLSDEVLRAIGRRHTARDVIDCFHTARALGHKNINMDLIAGLPADTVEGFDASLKGVMALQPENITVHTLTRKRASDLVIDRQHTDGGNVQQMLAKCALLKEQGYAPYYLYRQKGTLENLENTGYTKPGFTGLYNVFIMEEIHTILSAGAGGSTKLVAPGGGIQRVFNYKYPAEYLRGFDEMLARKQTVEEFYGKYFDLDSQTTG